MVLITKEYRVMNKVLHQKKSTYGKSGKKWASVVKDLMEKYQTKDVLDYGAGKGTLSEVLGGEIKEYDPCVKGKDKCPEKAGIVVCTDVLEHIEPECLDDVLAHIRSIMQKGGFFTISLREAKKKLPDGRNAHLIVETPDFWFSKLKYFNILLIDLTLESDTMAVWVE